MESMSILSLDDDCLCSILSCIDDTSSFYSFSLTCKRLNELAKRESNWHINVFKRKAEFYIRKFVVYCDKAQRIEISNLLEKAAFASTDRDLSYDEILNVWKSCGPVAAKFFSWITESTSKVTHEEGPRNSVCLSEYAEQTFHLPICGEELSISTSNYVSIYDEIIRFYVDCGDLSVEHEVSRISLEDYDNWDEHEMRAVVDPLRPVIKILQKELGDTVPPIADKFFVWMCFRFPSLSEENKIYFKDKTKNAKPTLESLQPVIALYQQNKAKRIEKNFEEWMVGKDESHSAKQIAHTVKSLIQKAQTPILTQLWEEAERFSDVVFDHDLRKAPHKLMLDLVNRTTLFKGNYTPGAVGNQHVDNTAHFRMRGGSMIKIDGLIHGDGACYFPTWFELKMTFSLPDGTKVQLPRTNFMHSLQSIDQKEGFIRKLSPITEILQECIDEAMKDEESIPKIQNIFTFYYFLQVMQFSGIIEFFEECKQDLFESSVESPSDFLDSNTRANERLKLKKLFMCIQNGLPLE